MSHTRTVVYGLRCLLVSICLLASTLLICLSSSAQAVAEHDGDAHWDPKFTTYTFQRVVALALDDVTFHPAIKADVHILIRLLETGCFTGT